MLKSKAESIQIIFFIKIPDKLKLFSAYSNTKFKKVKSESRKRIKNILTAKLAASFARSVTFRLFLQAKKSGDSKPNGLPLNTGYFPNPYRPPLPKLRRDSLRRLLRIRFPALQSPAVRGMACPEG